MNYRSLIKEAHDKKYAIPHFNFDSLQIAKMILEVCEEEKSPVFIATSISAVEYMGGYNVIYGIINNLKKDLNITVPVMLHLDHAKTLEDCYKAIDAGFDSVMLDYSLKTLEENIEGVKKVREYNSNIILECEVGHVGENGGEGIKHATVEDCERIINETNADMLAPAIGTVHGPYKIKQNINIDRLKEINEKLDMPLVLHGGSGTENISDLINKGITKVNVNTALKIAFDKGIKEYIEENPEVYDYRKYVKYSEKYVKEEIKKHIKLFGSSNRVE